MFLIEKLHGTTKKPSGYHLAYSGIVRARVKNIAAIKALRKRVLFSGIYRSKRFTIDAAYAAFAGVTFKK